MSNIRDAINSGIGKSAQGRRKAIMSRENNPITYSSLLLIFNTVMQGNSSGILSKEDTNKIRGLAKVLRNNGYTCGDTKIFLEKIVGDWDALKRDLITLKGKKWAAMSRPNLRDIAICRNDLLNKIAKERKDNKEDVEEGASFVDSILNQFEE